MAECCFLFLGDVVGQPGRSVLKSQLPVLLERYQPDFIFLNGENAAGGFGINASIAQRIKNLGISGITLGNHTWDQRGFWDEINNLDYICRPINFPSECPGRNYLIFEYDGQKIALFCVMGRGFMHGALDCPFKTSQQLIEHLKEDGISNFIVDVHAEATADKYALGWFLSQLGVGCVVGTHTHIQTADERLLNNQTAFICDLGMCGNYDSVLGFSIDTVLEKTIKGKPGRFDILTQGPRILSGVCVKLNLDTHCALSIEAFKVLEDLPTIPLHA